MPSPMVLRAALTAAVARQLIPPLSPAAIDTVMRRIEELRLRQEQKLIDRGQDEHDAERRDLPPQLLEEDAHQTRSRFLIR